MATMLKDALRYLSFGWSVIRIAEGEKTPALDGWKEYETRRASREEVKGWFEKHPLANVAVVGGAVSGRLLVVDCDSKRGFDAVTALLPKDFACPTVKTPRGGRHLYLKCPDGVRIGCAVRVGGLEVDIKCEGGYVLAPPSRTDAGEYVWLTPYDPEAGAPEVPKKLLEFILAHVNRKTATATAPKPTTVLDTVRDGVKEGERNDVLYKLGVRFVASGMSQEELGVALWVYNRGYFQPPLDKAEVEKVAQSAGESMAATGAAIDPDGPLNVVSYEQLPRRNPTTFWVVEGILTEGSLAYLVGVPKYGKSMLSLDLAIAVATGQKFLKRAVPVAGPVLVMQAEDPLPTVRARIFALRRGRGISVKEGESREPLYVVTNTALRLDTDKGLAKLEQAIIDYKPRLVIIDPMRRAWAGDENESKSMSVLLAGFRRLVRQHGTTILVVHHYNKDGGSSSKSKGSWIRGSTDLHASGDAYWYMTHPSKEDKNERVLDFELREAASPDPVAYRLQVSQDEKHREVLRIATHQKLTPLEGVASTVYEVLEDAEEPLGVAQLREAVKKRKETVLSAIDILLKRNLIRESTRDGARVFAASKPSRGGPEQSGTAEQEES